jgi:pyruvate dehydrogenase E2 component (dihydrolipoamide acetyltransferase)
VPIAEKPAPAPVEARAEPLPETKKPTDFQTAMRQAIAAAMSKSNREIPHYYMETSIDMTNALRWLEEENLKRTIRDRLLPVVVLVKAVAKSLTEVPELNGFWIDGAHQVSEAIHIGFAINLRQGGLITPAIHDADMKGLDELREAINDLITRTRSNKLRSSELTDSTITLTSLGDRGVEKVFGVIYPPQVALVGLGKITQQPWAVNGALCVRPVLVATLAGDHRATDGHKGGLFLEALNRNLQEVEKL